MDSAVDCWHVTTSCQRAGVALGSHAENGQKTNLQDFFVTWDLVCLKEICTNNNLSNAKKKKKRWAMASF